MGEPTPSRTGMGEPQCSCAVVGQSRPSILRVSPNCSLSPARPSWPQLTARLPLLPLPFHFVPAVQINLTYVRIYFMGHSKKICMYAYVSICSGIMHVVRMPYTYWQNVPQCSSSTSSWELQEVLEVCTTLCGTASGSDLIIARFIVYVYY